MLQRSKSPCPGGEQDGRHRHRGPGVLRSSITWVWATPIAVSAVHGHGTGDLLDACLNYFPCRRTRRKRTTM